MFHIPLTIINDDAIATLDQDKLGTSFCPSRKMVMVEFSIDMSNGNKISCYGNDQESI